MGSSTIVRYFASQEFRVTPGSILGRTSTQGLKVNEEKMALWEIRSPMSEKLNKALLLEETGVPVEN
jgi:hypothetical protein